MKRNFLFLLGLYISSLVMAQVNTVQPTIMVVPFIKEGEDARKVLDDANDKRQVINAIEGAFSKRGYKTKNIYQVFKNQSQRVAFQDGAATDLVSKIVAASGADISIEADININQQSNGTSVRVGLSAREVSTSNVLASKIGDSGRFYTTDIGKLGEKAIEKGMDDFLATMQNSFNDMIVNGRSISVEISFDEMSDYDMSSEVGSSGDELRDVLEEWMEQNAYKNYYHIQGTTDKSMIFDEVRIPLKNENGTNYNASKFGKQLGDFFKNDLGLEVKRTVSVGKLFIMVK